MFFGICEWRILNPVFIGDTIRVRVSVAEKRLTSDGGRAVVRMYYEVLNQNDEFVAKGYINRMIDLRENPEL